MSSKEAKQSAPKATKKVQPEAPKKEEEATPKCSSCNCVWKTLKIALVLIVIGILVQSSVDAPIHQFDLNAPPKYDLQPATGGRLTGTTLKIIAELVELPLVGSLLTTIMKKTNKFQLVRSLATSGSFSALFVPVEPVSEDVRAAHAKLAEESGDFLSSSEPIPTTSTDFRYPSIQDYRDAYLSQKTTPLEVIQKIIEFVESEIHDINAIPEMNKEDLLAQATESTKRYKAGKSLGIFDGIPVAVKNCVKVKGYILSHGTSFYSKIAGVADNDAISIARLRIAGAVIIGGVNMHELGLGTSGFNLHAGSAKNPHNRQHFTGGSSSGSAALVAAAIVPVAIGTDGGGSIRIPSGLCGVYGLKPTFGRVPDQRNAVGSVTVVGPIATNTRDLSLVYSIISGVDHSVPISTYQPQHHINGYNNINDLSDLTIGIFWDWFNDANPEVVAACKKQLDFLVSRGAKVVEIGISNLRTIYLAHSISITTESALSLESYYFNHRQHIQPENQILLSGARSLSARDFLSAQQVKRYAHDQIKSIFEKVDIIVTPTTPITAPLYQDDALPLGESDVRLTTELMRFASLANFVGIPGISCPAGYDSNALPIGFQAMAWQWNEHVLLRVAHALEGVAVSNQPKDVFASPL